MDMMEMMKQARSMQKELKKKQKELERLTFEGTAGGGMVTAVVNGKHEVVKLTIEPQLVAGGDAQMVADLVRAAINDSAQKAGKAAQELMSGMLGGLGGGLGGLGGLKNLFS